MGVFFGGGELRGSSLKQQELTYAAELEKWDIPTVKIAIYIPFNTSF